MNALSYIGEALLLFLGIILPFYFFAFIFG